MRASALQTLPRRGAVAAQESFEGLVRLQSSRKPNSPNELRLQSIGE